MHAFVFALYMHVRMCTLMAGKHIVLARTSAEEGIERMPIKYRMNPPIDSVLVEAMDFHRKGFSIVLNKLYVCC